MLDLHEPAAGSLSLAPTLQAGVVQAQRTHKAVLVSVTRAVPALRPLAIFQQGVAFNERCYWEQPALGRAFVGLGAAHTVVGLGADRFRHLDEAWETLLAEGVVVRDAEAREAGPLAFAGFAFDPLHPATATWAGFPPGLLLVPRLLVQTTPGQTWLTLTTLVWPASDADAEARRLDQDRAHLLATRAAETGYESWLNNNNMGPRAGDRPDLFTLPQSSVLNPQSLSAWQATVAQAAAAVQAGELDKVVLAREVITQAERPFDLGQALDRLRTGYPHCAVFAVARGGRCFLGASPERLVRMAAGRVEVACLAGSAARGVTRAEDARLGAALLASTKNRREHAVVAAMLHAALAEVCTDVDVPASPQLLKLANVQHLYTPVTARLAPGGRPLELVARLHPTPAVGGAPRLAALAWIRAHEGLDRGWYAGPVGWLDAVGNGEFAVALRSALVAGSTAHLFAGCGIVGDSDPAAEYAESELKLRPMLGALGVTSET